MERKGYLKSSLLRAVRRARRVYRETAKGAGLAFAKERVHELFGELIEGW